MKSKMRSWISDQFRLMSSFLLLSSERGFWFQQDPKVFWFRRVRGDFQTIFSDFIVLRLILSSISISKSSSISKYSLILILSLISKSSSSYVRTRDAIASKNLEILWMYETLTAESWCGWDIGPQFEILMNQKLLPNIFSALTFGSALWTV